MSEKPLSDKVAVVTGASRGIGKGWLMVLGKKLDQLVTVLGIKYELVF